jgi:hypothetical protein
MATKLSKEAADETVQKIIDENIVSLEAAKQNKQGIEHEILLVVHYLKSGNIETIALPSVETLFVDDESKSRIKPIVHRMFSLMDVIESTVAAMDEGFEVQPLAVIVISDMYAAKRERSEPVIPASQCANRTEAIGFIVSTEYSDYIQFYPYSSNEQGQIVFEEPTKIDNTSLVGRLAGLFPKPEKI